MEYHNMNTKKPSRGADTSKYVHQNAKINWPIAVKELPWTPKQHQLIQLLQDKTTKCVFIKGPSGTSKTCTAVYSMLNLLRDKKISDIIYVRTAVESASHSLGFLPGDAQAKIAAYAIPFFDKLDELLSKPMVEKLIAEQRVQATVVNYMRGQHLAAKAVFVDECQNATAAEIITLMTRMGEHSKLVLAGDHHQSDLRAREGSAFNKFYTMFDNEQARNNGVHVFEFTKDDIVRSEFVRYIVGVLEQNEYGHLV